MALLQIDRASSPLGRADQPAVYLDDPDTLAMGVLELDLEVIMAAG